MMTLRAAIREADTILLDPSSPRVAWTVAEHLKAEMAPAAGILSSPGREAPPGSIRLSVATALGRHRHLPDPGTDSWMTVLAPGNGGIHLAASHPHLLYGLFCLIKEDWGEEDLGEFSRGRSSSPAFPGLRPLYDLFLTQHARGLRSFDRAAYFRELARTGFSHAEVNGLAFPFPLETGPPGEVLHRFYTYGPALDQFVASRLNDGIYPREYLQKNLDFLKTNAELAGRYGLIPGLLCYEPRSVPDALLEKYPMLRGARVDHPQRSFRPRFNLSLGHPLVRQHYHEMVANLLKEVPTLGYITIWSNDSGAGFEYTNSLYAGRNGGGYVIREWKPDTEIAKAAALNIIRFMKLLRDAARTVNPQFRVLIRLEPFWAELDHLWRNLEEGLEVETSSLLKPGWELAYTHPKYTQTREIHTTALHNRFSEREKPLLEALRAKGSDASVIFAPGILWNHEPLTSLPFPWLVYEKLSDMAEAGVRTACALGGAVPGSFAPFNINQELLRAFQLNRRLDLPEFLHRKAASWAGKDLADDLVEIWRLSDDAFRSFPVPIWIYAAWGVWYRLLIRPLVPDIEAIPQEKRAYYEKHLLSTPHNRNRIDLRYDVGFDLADPAYAEFCAGKFDSELFPALDAALTLAEAGARKEARRAGAPEGPLGDLLVRLRAGKCWYRTQRNVAAWIAGVHGYLESGGGEGGKQKRALVRAAVLDEAENARQLLTLWENSRTNWMIMADTDETTFLYGRNFGELLRKKIALMTGREDDEPRIDPGFQWRVPGLGA